MKTPRLYFNLENHPQGNPVFYYYDFDINSGSDDLKSFKKELQKKDCQEIFELFQNKKENVLYTINAMEYSRLLKESELYKKNIDELGNFNPLQASTKLEHVLNTHRLIILFKNWFEENGFTVPSIRKTDLLFQTIYS